MGWTIKTWQFTFDKLHCQASANFNNFYTVLTVKKSPHAYLPHMPMLSVLFTKLFGSKQEKNKHNK